MRLENRVVLCEYCGGPTEFGLGVCSHCGAPLLMPDRVMMSVRGTTNTYDMYAGSTGVFEHSKPSRNEGDCWR